MHAPRLGILVMAGLFAVGGCKATIDNGTSPGGNGSAENKAEEGQVSISAPGVEMKIDIPEGLRREADVNDGLIYPGSTMSGIHVASNGDRGNQNGEVELRFTTTAAPDTVATWYRDPARARDFTIASATREGEAFLLAGTTRDHGRVRIRISPRAGGGAEGRILVSERE